jgi:hypothetical protein
MSKGRGIAENRGKRIETDAMQVNPQVDVASAARQIDGKEGFPLIS